MWHKYISPLWSLFILQSSRNERTVDGLGFFHALATEITRWNATDDELKDIARRHMGYFNANPILASYILGAVLNMERRKLHGEEISNASIERIKSTLSSVLTAKGDYFFEVVLIPLGLTIACIFAMYRSYFGPIIFLVLYNYYHLQARIGGYLMGVRMGEGVGRELVKHIFREQGFLGGCAAFASGVLAASTFVKAHSFGGLRLSGWGVAVLIAAFLLRRKLSMVMTVLVVFMASAAYLLLI